MKRAAGSGGIFQASPAASAFFFSDSTNAGSMLSSESPFLATYEATER
jgi:hypothetical protein